MCLCERTKEPSHSLHALHTWKLSILSQSGKTAPLDNPSNFTLIWGAHWPTCGQLNTEGIELDQASLKTFDGHLSQGNLQGAWQIRKQLYQGCRNGSKPEQEVTWKVVIAGRNWGSHHAIKSLPVCSSILQHHFILIANPLAPLFYGSVLSSEMDWDHPMAKAIDSKGLGSGTQPVSPQWTMSILHVLQAKGQGRAESRTELLILFIFRSWQEAVVSLHVVLFMQIKFVFSTSTWLFIHYEPLQTKIHHAIVLHVHTSMPAVPSLASRAEVWFSRI